MMVVDGSDSEMVKNTMETEMNAIEERHTRGQEVFLSMSSYSPAFGMVGTLIGLINMLRNLNNIDSLGLNMAVALITTFYGVIMANLVLTPLAKRLKERTELEMRHKAMILEGVLAIQAGLNPRVIEQKLKAFLSETEIAEIDSVIIYLGIVGNIPVNIDVSSFRVIKKVRYILGLVEKLTCHGCCEERGKHIFLRFIGLKTDQEQVKASRNRIQPAYKYLVLCICGCVHLFPSAHSQYIFL
jgi:hypothetical protein